MILIALALVLSAFLPLLVRAIQKEKARERQSTQFRTSLQNITHALRVGVGLSQALDYTAKEGAEPLASEWRRVQQAVRIGEPLSQALEEFAQRVPMKEVRWFTTAVQITQNTGGSLAEVLETLAGSLQEQQTLREKIKALTAQGKASGILLAILPYALLAALSVIAPDMASVLFQTAIGQMVLVGVTLSLCVGGLVIKKIVTIPVD